MDVAVSPPSFAHCQARSRPPSLLVAAPRLEGARGPGGLSGDAFTGRGVGRTLLLFSTAEAPGDLPATIVAELHRVDERLTAHVSLIEECLLRPWPGSGPELRAAVAEAARRA